jgi:sulfide:quinone oxidoreductase
MKQDYLQMKMLEVAPQVFAAGQLFETDLQLISKQGARSIINTRPDNEFEGQPSSADLAKAAKEYGITFVHFPVEPGSIIPETAEAFAKACDDLERPLIVCARSGALSTRIWETAELAGEVPPHL